MSEAKPLVCIVDDDDAMRKALSLLVRSAGLEAEEFASAREYLARSRTSRPSCAIVDLRMGEIDGLELQQRLRGAGEETPLIFLTGHGDVPASVEAMKAGAVDFLTKPCEDHELLDAIHVALERDRATRTARDQKRQLELRFATLTPRERQVCEMVADGMLNKQVAFELGIAEKTVKVHRGRVMQKLGADSLAGLVRLVESLRAAGG